MIRRRTITSYVWNSVSGNKMVILSNCIRNFFRKFELLGNSTQGENPAPDNPQEIKSAGRFDEASGKYLLDVKVTGKNLLNLQKQPDVKKTYLGWKVSNGEKIALSVKDKGNNADITGCYLGLSRTGGSADGVVWVVKNGSVAVKEIVSTNQYVSVHPPNETAVQKLLNRFDIQVEEGTVATDYEPYTEQSMQIALDEPLRGIGEYKDMLTKDGVTRKIKKIALDGSEGWLIDKIVEGNVTQTFVLILKDMLLISNHDKRIMCDKFKFGTALWANDIVAIGTYSNKLYLNVEKDKTPDLQTFKTWLSQNPLAVDYVLAEPITEPLPESVQQQLQALHSENGATHVFVDSGEVEAGINIEYKCKS